MKFKNVKLDMKVILKDNWENLSPNSVKLKTITKSDFYTVDILANEADDLTGLNVRIRNHLNELAWVSAKALKKYEPKEIKLMLTEEENNIFVEEFEKLQSLYLKQFQMLTFFITQCQNMQKFYIYSRCVELNFEHMFAILESCIKIS